MLFVKDHVFLQLLFYPRLNLSGRHGSRRASDFLALAEQDKAWHGLDGVAGRDGALRLGIHFGQDDLSLQRGGGQSEGRRHHFARSAPGCPEVDEHGQGGAGGEALKGLIRELDWMTRQEGRCTFGAYGLLANAIRENGIDGLAFRADGVYFSHEVGLRFVVGLNFLGINIFGRRARWREEMKGLCGMRNEV